jgi:tetratricopeptide (TPR) repeat protein
VPLRIVFEETLEPFFEVSMEAAVSYALVNQAGIARIRGDLERAAALLRESEERFELAGDERGLADVHARRAYLELAEGSIAAARSSLELALRLRRRLNDLRGVGLALSGLCLVDIAAGELERAETHVTEAGDIFRRAGDRWGLASALWRTADLGLVRGRLEEAEAALDEARLVVAETGRDRWLAHTLAGLAEVAARRGDGERASALLVEARDLYAGRTDAAAVAHVDERLQALQSAG